MRSLSRLIPYVKRYRREIAAGMVCLVAVDVIQLYFPLLMARAVDAVRESRIDAAHHALIWMAGLAAVIVAVRYFWRRLLLGASRKIERDLRDDFFSKLLRVPQSFLDTCRSGDLLSLSTNDIAVIRQFLGLGMMSLCDAVVLISFSVFLMLTLSVPLTLLVALPLPFITFAMLNLGVHLHAAHEDTQDRFGEMSARLQEDLYGVRVLRGFGQEENRTRRFLKEAETYRTNTLAVIRLQAFFYPFLKFLTGTAVVLVIWFGGREVIRGTLSLGQFVAFTEYIALLAWPLMALGWIINLVQRARASMERLERVFAVPEEQNGGRKVHSSSARLDLLEIRGLTQMVQSGGNGSGGSFGFHSVNLSVRRGEWVALVGKIASGKSALVTRILRIYEPPPGTILLDGMDVTEMDIEGLRSRIAYVPQEGFLFSQSLLGNFRLGLSGLPESSVREMVRAVRMEDEVREFPDGLATRVGERGITLSGGQRQRVALGRALLKDADFYIFDDPFSGVDVETEERIFEELRGRISAAGVLLISHRLRSLSKVDRIVVLDDGKVAETGTHRELMSRSGLYRKMVEAQALKERLSDLVEERLDGAGVV
ncbi:ABC transporter ATP-binding protein [bacterium]|nr:ABC transporter ATP-binding protein [bacterium]